ncbi:hypothetical protein BOX15_Mlig031632g1, partial [Macrostomum lignano]
HYNKAMPRKSQLKTKNRPAADLDQVAADLASPTRTRDLLYRQPDEDLPGAGQYYCLVCARHMTDRQALLEHRRGKPHKRRLKELGDKPYAQAEADAAGGLGVYSRPAVGDKRRRIVEPLKPELSLPAAGSSAPIEPAATPAKAARLVEQPMRTGNKDL